jgi:hypothetical protein
VSSTLAERIEKKVVVLDSRSVDTLPAIPL